MILFEKGMLSFDLGASESSARAALSAELDKWMARQDHQAKHVEVFHGDIARLHDSVAATHEDGHTRPRRRLGRLHR